MEIKIQCDCCRQLRIINAKVKLEEEINDQIMTMIVTPCPNCINSSWHHGYEQGKLQQNILLEAEKKELKEKVEKAKNIKELEQLMNNFWENKKNV